MRSLNKNKQLLYYAQYGENKEIYQRDSDGNIEYVVIDGEQQPIILESVPGYNDPVLFYANLSMSGGEAASREYGISTSDYEAVIISTDKSLPIDELTRIWCTSTPTYNSDGSVNGDSADYEVIAVRPSLNVVRYFLKKLPKVGE